MWDAPYLRTPNPRNFNPKKPTDSHPWEFAFTPQSAAAASPPHTNSDAPPAPAKSPYPLPHPPDAPESSSAGSVPIMPETPRSFRFASSAPQPAPEAKVSPRDSADPQYPPHEDRSAYHRKQPHESSAPAFQPLSSAG